MQSIPVSPQLAKSFAKKLRTSLQKKGYNIQHSESLELISEQLGFKNWNTYVGAYNTLVKENKKQYPDSPLFLNLDNKPRNRPEPQMVGENIYRFLIGQPSELHAYLDIYANSAKEAAEKANKAISNDAETVQAPLRYEFSQSLIELPREFTVSTDMIFETFPSTNITPPNTFIKYITNRGYTYSMEGDFNLASDPTPEFQKYLVYGDLFYGWMKVRAAYEYNIEDFSYFIEVVLTPGSGRKHDEDGSISLMYGLKDREAFNTLKDLKKVLPLYEEKIKSILTTLHKKKLVDPLSSASFLIETGHSVFDCQ